MNKFTELKEELSALFSIKGAGILDSIFPPLAFLIINQVADLNAAVLGAVVVGVVTALIRLIQKQKLWFALGGLAGALVAALFASLSGSQAGFYLPGFFSGAVTVVLCLVSVILKKPLAAWSSSIARRWPLQWYFHPQVLPAYSEVTLMWAFAFGARLILQFILLQKQAADALGVVRVFLDWPYTITILIVSYLYGLWRLNALQGPSVAEFKSGAEAPWVGQKRGF